MAILRVAEARQPQGTAENVAYTVDTSNVGGSPTGGTVIAYDLSDARTNVTSTVIPGTVSVSSDTITTPEVTALTAGHLYEIHVQFTTGTQDLDHYFEIQALDMARAGMSHLVVSLRRMVDDIDRSVWVDQEVLDTLDLYKVRVQREPLEMEKTLTSGTTYEYKKYYSRHRNFEAGGTAYFNVEDSAGLHRAAGTYTADYLRGMVTMATDQVGTQLFLTGWSYDLDGAAAQLWREKAGKHASHYNVRADGHILSRSQWFKHCLQMAQVHEQRSHPIMARQWVTDGVLDYR
jgi:hypothetical protein